MIQMEKAWLKKTVQEKVIGAAVERESMTVETPEQRSDKNPRSTSSSSASPWDRKGLRKYFRPSIRCTCSFA